MITSLLSLRGAWRADLVIDLGSANTRVLVPGQGIVFDEPTLCCFDDRGAVSALVAAGTDAAEMVDRASGRLRIAWPLRRGVLDDMAAGRALINHAVRRSTGAARVSRLRALIGVPADATQAERQALLATAADAGLTRVRLATEPVAAAIGAGLPVGQPVGSMIIECGAGTTEVAVLSLGEICVLRSVRIGGDSLDAALVDYLQLRRRFLISGASAERVKRQIFALQRVDDKDLTVAVKGRSLISRTPDTLEIPLSELLDVMRRHVEPIVDAVRAALSSTPPELSRDIHDRGIVLTGGSAIFELLAEAIQTSTGLDVHIAPSAMGCVIAGLGAIAAAE
ncbi:MAG: rod shape-determining protein MreB [Bradyrhizobium sp.]